MVELLAGTTLTVSCITLWLGFTVLKYVKKHQEVSAELNAALEANAKLRKQNEKLINRKPNAGVDSLQQGNF